MEREGERDVEREVESGRKVDRDMQRKGRLYREGDRIRQRGRKWVLFSGKQEVCGQSPTIPSSSLVSLF